METGIFVNSGKVGLRTDPYAVQLSKDQGSCVKKSPDNAYTREKILRMEKAILNMLQWNITIPTPYVFFLQFAAAVTSSDSKNDKEIGVFKAIHG
ncbi:cyclin-B1-1-like [Lolium rigidum]|uniref:cyclin-B1-1-like n=1 Tax=Lolium rigidum TaxID=89674 RepID=UPI001F5C3058|nr:cyclin-B1-1-like [Lolium rigidum]